MNVGCLDWLHLLVFYTFYLILDNMFLLTVLNMYNKLKTVETTVLYGIFNIIMIPDENDWCCINVNLSIKLAV